MLLNDVCNKRVLLRADLANADRYPHKINHLIPTIITLLQQGCGICIMSSMGIAFMPQVSSARSVYNKLNEMLHQEVHWVDYFLDISMENGQIYFIENPYHDTRDRECPQGMVSEVEAYFDVVVHDTLNQLDKEFATSFGLLGSKTPQVIGRYLEDVEAGVQSFRQSKIGLILGGTQVALQLRLVRQLSSQLSFLAVGGELALVMMGKGQEMPGSLHDDILMTINMLRAEKVKVLYPVDVVAYSQETQRNRICLYQDLDSAEAVKDLATQSRNRILSQIEKDKVNVVIFSGAVGQHLDPRYSRGTDILIQDLARLSHKKVLIGKDVALAAKRLSVLGGYQLVLEGNTMELDFIASGDQSILSWLSKDIGIESDLC
ncbi:MAG: phosphoglycerate kinase [Pseudomonadota bacterium]|nr:phosphoglycerate kinase [Pseudomonadota bacterium]